jgi:catechol 2,3-dioxygenase-like lactoylglutathione lyase family enzyme
MEALIARLLNDFENGRMSRRQLVQSLAMAAVAAPFASAGAKTGGIATGSASAPLPASLPAVPYKTVWLDHISFGCTDYKRSADFYTDLMGWTPVPGSDNGRQVILNVGDIGQIIVRNSARPSASAGASASAPPPATAGAQGRGGPRPPVNAVIDHIAFGVEPWDTETVRAELEKRGLKPREDTGGPDPIATAKYKSFHVRDPDGWDLQISNASKAHHDLP